MRGKPHQLQVAVSVTGVRCVAFKQRCTSIPGMFCPLKPGGMKLLKLGGMNWPTLGTPTPTPPVVGVKQKTDAGKKRKRWFFF
jgi:hypothetical protein